MGYILMAYASGGYQEYMLPDIDNADYTILLDREVFGLRNSLELPLEIMDGVWRFVRKRDIRLRQRDGEDGFGKGLEDGLILNLSGEQEEHIALVTLQCGDSFPAFQKYDLLHINQITVGKDADSHICYDFAGFISWNHALLFRHGSRWVVQDNSSNGTYLNGRRISGQTFLKFGDQITLFGLRLIFLESCLAVCALSGEPHIDEKRLPRFYPRKGLFLPPQEIAGEEKRYFKRAPRTVEKLYTEKIEIEAPPQLSKTKKRPLLLTIGPSLTMAVPMLLGCLMTILSSRIQGGSSGVYMFTGLVTAVSSAVIGVIWALTNIRYTNRAEEEDEELRYNAYGRYLIEITEFIKQKYDGNREIMYRTWLSGKECCAFGREDARLWNHNSRQEDFLTVRLGTGTIPFQAEIAIPKERFTLVKDDLADKPRLIRENYQMLHSVPVCLDIRGRGLIGIVGGAGKEGAYAVAQNIAAQIAAQNCYTDVRMVFFYDQNQAPERWSFARWLPHVWLDGHKTRLIAGNKAEVGDICYEMSKILQIRTEETEGKKEYPLPHFVIFVDSMELLQGELLERFLYHPRPEYGITAVLLTEKYEELPNSCESVIQNDGRASRFFHVYNEEEESRDLVFDTVGIKEVEQLSRRLCDVEVNEESGSGEIPDSIDFLEMYGVRTLEQLHVLDRWKKNRNYESMRVPIGQKAGGALCCLDIHEKYHGPHGLLAGTTGSGKSETLQTYILSLAVNFSPDDIAFFIIDYKGGGMANLFTDLPHLAGQITNLSGNQTQRAMISIKSENMRRQRIFAEHNVNNINLYTKLYKNHEARVPVPHLFIVIDEFAELKREETDFMKELISVAQVGRSLGVHLILATQRPSGTVDENIRGNSKFRICLRVQDRQDSNDVLHKPDAAYITQAGRGYLQVGSDEIYEQFQSGYSGAEYDDDPENRREASAVMITLTGKEIRSGRRIKRQINKKSEPSTQLDAVIRHLRDTSEKNGYGRGRMRLWLPALPKELYLEEADESMAAFQKDGWNAHGGRWSLGTVVGTYDDPANQAQGPFHISFSEGGHLAVCGMVDTGKSTFLQTLLYGLICRYSPKELNFYVLDYSGRSLLSFANAPHCGGVVTDTDTDKVKKTFYMLNGMLEERKRLFGGGNYGQYIQSHEKKEALPAVILVIDNCANFREKTGGEFDNALLRLSREGVGYGIFLALTAAGFGVSEIPTRVGDNIRTVVSLEMNDKFKYAEVLHTTRVEILPEKDAKGRGLMWLDDRLLEFQTALAVKAEDAYGRSSAIEELCTRMSEVWKGRTARKIPEIPENPVLKDFADLEEWKAAVKAKRGLPLGYDSQDASVYAVDLWKTYCYIVQGRGRSGKKNVLKLLIYAAAAVPEAKIWLIEPAGGGLGKSVEKLPVTRLEDDQSVYDFFESTIPVFKERNARKQQLLKQDVEETELAGQMNRGDQYFIFISDMSAFMKTAYASLEGRGSIRAYLENITEKGSYHGFFFIAAVNPDQHMDLLSYRAYKNMVSYGTGVHLGGNVAAQKVFSFGGIPYQEQNRVYRPGIGLVPSEDDAESTKKIVLPLAKGVLS